MALLVGLALAGVLAVAGMEVAIRRFGVMAGAILLVTAAETAVEALPGLTLGSFTVYAGDVLLGFLAGATAARLLRRLRLTPLHACLLALAALVGFSLLRGFAAHDVARVLNEARDTLYFLAAAVYFAGLDLTQRSRDLLARLLLALAGFLVLLAAVRWVAVVGGLPYGGAWRDQASYGGLRVLWSDEALVLSQAFVVLLPRWLDGSLARPYRRLAVVLACGVALLQHRSVWVCTLVGVLVVFQQQASVRQRGGLRLAAGMVAAAGVVALLLPGAVTPRDSDALSTATFEWRMEGWGRVIAQRGPTHAGEVLYGLPYGTGWERGAGRFTIDVGPHNYYVELGLRVGLVGVALLLVVYGVALRRLSSSRRPGTGLLPDRTLAALLVIQLVYFIPYWPRMEQGIVLGLAVGACYRIGSGTRGVVDRQVLVEHA